MKIKIKTILYSHKNEAMRVNLMTIKCVSLRFGSTKIKTIRNEINDKYAGNNINNRNSIKVI